ncbi:ABC transporter permease [Vibrio salinus]|uniref:ABC transporter permease n=1 Tax=Vibrio salinus TaxID=2899784 RepID=UPI001E3B21A8|nr:ABC transporter permease [Vibrio salinus]MCE0495162.1 ABC transporter permease [Vibrio salinus]
MNHPWLNRCVMWVLIVLCFLWLVIPFAMAVLWSLVDPHHAWAYPDMLPPVLSFERWKMVWTTTSLPDALINSYTLAPLVACLCMTLAFPTAWAFGRFNFPGKQAAQLLTLIPLVIPGFVIGIFFSSLLLQLGLHSRFTGILVGHTVLFMPYAIRILSVSFALVRQDLIDAARDLGASPLTTFRTAYLPVLKPGFVASFIIIFIMSIEEFALAFIIGSPDFTTVPTILYSYLGYNFVRPNAAVVSLILVIPNVLLMLVVERLLKNRNTVAITGKG